jgi:GNAT superfamily N-acetyltransferase
MGYRSGFRTHEVVADSGTWRTGFPGNDLLLQLACRSAFLPYRRYFSNAQQAAACYVGQFCLTEDPEGARPPDRVYFHDAAFALVRMLADESRFLLRPCARLEPFLFSFAEATIDEPGDGHALDAHSIAEGATFLNDILARTHCAQHLSTPVAAGDTALQLVLNAAGFRMADTILALHLELANLDTGAPHPNVRPAVPTDIPRLASIAHGCFSRREVNINRFNSDPGFAGGAVGDLYGHWISAAVASGEGLVLVYDDGQAQGFMSFAVPDPLAIQCGLPLGRAILSSVDPRSQKRGIYRLLLLAGCRWLREQGASLVEGRTQLSNTPVLSVWQRLGGTLAMAYHTYHWSRR